MIACVQRWLWPISSLSHRLLCGISPLQQISHGICQMRQDFRVWQHAKTWHGTVSSIGSKKFVQCWRSLWRRCLLKSHYGLWRQETMSSMEWRQCIARWKNRWTELKRCGFASLRAWSRRYRSIHCRVWWETSTCFEAAKFIRDHQAIHYSCHRDHHQEDGRNKEK